MYLSRVVKNQYQTEAILMCSKSRIILEGKIKLCFTENTDTLANNNNKEQSILQKKIFLTVLYSVILLKNRKLVIVEPDFSIK